MHIIIIIQCSYYNYEKNIVFNDKHREANVLKHKYKKKVFLFILKFEILTIECRSVFSVCRPINTTMVCWYEKCVQKNPTFKIKKNIRKLIIS